MNILSWNCRGLRRRLVVDAISYNVRVHWVYLLFLQETHSDEGRVKGLARCLGCSWMAAMFPTAGASGGIALLWNSTIVRA